MLKDFFKLDEPYKTFSSYDMLKEHFDHADDLKSVLFEPPELSSVKFRDKKFRNVSFSKKLIRNVTFTRCQFVDCLFIGTQFEGCEFHDCLFEGCNPYKCSFKSTYIDPAAFGNMLNPKAHSNIGVYFFSQLRHNSAEMHQKDFEASADFEFRKWLRYQLAYDRRMKRVSMWKFLRRWTPDFAYFVLAGYGHRGSFFAGWTVFLLIILVALNYYCLQDFSIGSPTPLATSHSLGYSIYHTLVTFTTLGSNAIAVTTRGMFLLAGEAVLGALWLSVFTSMIVKRVVR